MLQSSSNLLLPPLHPGVIGEKSSEDKEDENNLGKWENMMGTM